MRYLLSASVVLFVMRWLRRRTVDGVSIAWRQDQERRSWGYGIDGVTWKWPVGKR